MNIMYDHRPLQTSPGPPVYSQTSPGPLTQAHFNVTHPSSFFPSLPYVTSCFLCELLTLAETAMDV